MNPVSKSASIASLALLSGCASQASVAPGLTVADGWRRGTVVEIGPATSIERQPFGDCRSETSPRGSNAQFASVIFRKNGYPAFRIVRLDPKAGIHLGDAVYVNTLDCSQPLTRRQG